MGKATHETTQQGRKNLMNIVCFPLDRPMRHRPAWAKPGAWVMPSKCCKAPSSTKNISTDARNSLFTYKF